MRLDKDSVRESIRQIIDSIKQLEPGFDRLADDDPLFNYDASRPSPVNLDSLDALDLAMCLSNEFAFDDAEFEELIESDEGMKSLRTINDITDLIIFLSDDPTRAHVARSTDTVRKEVRA